MHMPNAKTERRVGHQCPLCLSSLPVALLAFLPQLKAFKTTQRNDKIIDHWRRIHVSCCQRGCLKPKVAMATHWLGCPLNITH
eukprot:scaffold104018_cov17-Prasinocladus_malaysianus.AAC.1